ncbi:GNAT family N-acetyltransferase [Paenibacillus glycanilyticus]|uniref:GNAT family N-acetyltransferase n=1 Tax=Paenibacillus glycanilyticus TaxID=126569 RepID=UPI000FDAA03B|nr:GNAT family N-acetyltransferase [Paenibacillus glycanilyticus]
MIKKMTHSNKDDYNKSNESFLVTGRIIPKFENDHWTYTEESFSEPYLKKYENDDIDESYMEHAEKAVFFYYADDKCIGRIKLRSNWNGFALVVDIGVSASSRQQGIGTRLLEKAVEWARQNHQIGLMLETQDVNLSACRFYARNHFIIGGVDTMLYSKFSTAREKAIFWYRKF